MQQTIRAPTNEAAARLDEPAAQRDSECEQHDRAAGLMHAECLRTSRNRPTQARCCSQSCPAQLADLPKVPAQSGALALGKLARVLVQPPTKSPRVHNRASTSTRTVAGRHGAIRPALPKKTCTHHHAQQPAQAQTHMQTQERALGMEAGRAHQSHARQLLVGCCCRLLLSAAVVAALGRVADSGCLRRKSALAAAAAVL